MQPLAIAGDDLGQDAPDKVVVVVPPRLELEKVVVVVPPPSTRGLKEGSCATRALKKDPVLRGPYRRILCYDGLKEGSCATRALKKDPVLRGLRGA